AVRFAYGSSKAALLSLIVLAVDLRALTRKCAARTRRGLDDLRLDVAGDVAIAQHELLDLARRRLRELVDEGPPPGRLVGRQLLTTEGEEGRSVGRGARSGAHEGG